MRWSLMLVAIVAGCAASPAWPPRIDRLPEGVAGPIAPMQSGPLELDEVVALVRSETPSGVIIQKLRDSRTVYAISAEQAASLASRGVPPEVLAYLRYGEEGIAPRVYVPAYPGTFYGGSYGYSPYGFHPPYRAYPYGPGYHGRGLFFGLSSSW